MSDNKSSSGGGGIGVLGLLGVVFVTLKLCGVINWSWWWVTCPFWGGMALVVGILLIIGIVFLIRHCVRKYKSKIADFKRAKNDARLVELIQKNYAFEVDANDELMQSVQGKKK
jgi:predicted ferric reductase